MCNRCRMTAKQAELAATFGILAPYLEDETFPVGDIFPTGNKTPFYGSVIVQNDTVRTIERMEWGVPTQVPSKRDQTGGRVFLFFEADDIAVRSSPTCSGVSALSGGYIDIERYSIAAALEDLYNNDGI